MIPHDFPGGIADPWASGMGHSGGDGRDERGEPERTTGTVEVVRLREQAVRTEGGQAPAVNRKVELTMPGGLGGLDAMYARLNYATHYALLGVATSASPKEVRSAYLALARHYHPDLGARRELAPYRRKIEAVFDAITRACETLGRPASRAQYDDSIRLAPEQRHAFRVRPGIPRVVESEHDRVARESRRLSSAPPPPMEAQAEPPALETLPSTLPLAEPSTPAPLVQAMPPVELAVPESALPPESSAPEASVQDTRAPRPARQRSLAQLVEERASRAQAQERKLARTTAGEEAAFGASTQLRELERLAENRKPAVPPATGVTARPQRERGSTGPDTLPSLVTIGLEFHAGKGLQLWLSQQVRAAHQAELVGRAEEAATLLRQAFAQCKDPRIAAHAERLTRRALEKTVEGHRESAEFHEEQELWADAALDWESITKVHPDDGDAHLQQARCLLKASDLKAAGRPAMRATELLPESIEAREILVAFFERMGMKLNAQREHEALVRLIEASAAKRTRP